MGLLTNLFGKSGASPGSPWVADSIFRLIKSRVDPVTGRIGDVELPDEEERDGRIRWAPGAMDGVGVFHVGKSNHEATAKKIAKLLDEIARTGAERAQDKLYPLLVEESVLDVADNVVKLLTKRETPIDPHLSAYALRLATETRHRGPVKMGLVLLGVMRQVDRQDVVLTLGKHDEFTLFATVALTNMLEHPSGALWGLAKCVDGWGRIHIVERLVPTDDADLQYWLRTEGYRNSVMYEYLAHTAAVHGRLLDGLSAPVVTPKELRAASEIIHALIVGGPAEGIAGYAQAAAACAAYLERVGAHPPELCHYLTARLIRSYLDDDKRETAERLKNGWSDASLARVRQLANALIEQPVWLDIVTRGLKSTSEEEFYEASRAADEMKLDTFEVHWQRLVDRPESGRWFAVMHRATAESIDRIVPFAEQTIPLERIATGPARELGLGKQFEAHSCLDFIVQDLKRFPGKGWKLIAASLKSPVIRNRNMALNAFAAWRRDEWPPDAMAVLTEARRREPDEELKQRLGELIGSAPGQ